MPLQSFTFENNIVCVTIERCRVNITTHRVTVIVNISVTGFSWVHFPLYLQIAREEDEVESDHEE